MTKQELTAFLESRTDLNVTASEINQLAQDPNLEHWDLEEDGEIICAMISQLRGASKPVRATKRANRKPLTTQTSHLEQTMSAEPTDATNPGTIAPVDTEPVVTAEAIGGIDALLESAASIVDSRFSEITGGIDSYLSDYLGLISTYTAQQQQQQEALVHIIFDHYLAQWLQGYDVHKLSLDLSQKQEIFNKCLASFRQKQMLMQQNMNSMLQQNWRIINRLRGIPEAEQIEAETVQTEVEVAA